uniref:60S acidic ribosomal protein P2 n=1 Tax=Compsopogon caeruleus TaxID=31354 RepID=A0A7S1TD81_9RHOD|mmetsp:Transcript_18519/g.38803  ORF Transcript_18519/g.38803 Transcript_18519/m.38803 type:complete len:106 (+) Transcript_18519:902-1219(+)|eukprot:CAMPEP_0184688488 /NCGR_PEP_ID=MMETSP0312-20130426/30045_1 /TAXON_ID=31354 /ORGANISM="Compsopogon coeruleus, Strain SAG 36.94" /LENGTH=105 /DNA_ID=CAMNT_0027145705 /DNA_START=797 /DNA_END=1114 /DNA_ORIENTATION=-
MKYLGTFMLTVTGGIESPSDIDVKKIIPSVGAEVDDYLLAKVIAELEGKDLPKLMGAGREILVLVLVGRGVAVSSGTVGVGVADAGGDAPAAAEKKRRGKKKKAR